MKKIYNVTHNGISQSIKAKDSLELIYSFSQTLFNNNFEGFETNVDSDITTVNVLFSNKTETFTFELLNEKKFLLNILDLKIDNPVEIPFSKSKFKASDLEGAIQEKFSGLTLTLTEIDTNFYFVEFVDSFNDKRKFFVFGYEV